tara:strand:- start:544 stop:846 length:303 start_codon:yes stop_codon:yes gene_type:complete
MTTNTFKYDKESIFVEFNDAKAKDTKLGKGDDNKVHTNRIKFLRDMIDLEAKMPEVFSYVNINFKNLLNVYLTQDPRLTFYMKVFGKGPDEMAAEQAYDG